MQYLSRGLFDVENDIIGVVERGHWVGEAVGVRKNGI